MEPGRVGPIMDSLLAQTVPTTHPHGMDRPPWIGIGTPSPIPRTVFKPN